MVTKIRNLEATMTRSIRVAFNHGMRLERRKIRVSGKFLEKRNLFGDPSCSAPKNAGGRGLKLLLEKSCVDNLSGRANVLVPRTNLVNERWAAGPSANPHLF